MNPFPYYYSPTLSWRKRWSLTGSLDQLSGSWGLIWFSFLRWGKGVVI